MNTKGTEGEVSDELREVIRYLDDGSVSGAYIRELEDAVNTVKGSEERRHEYMIMMVREQELVEEGREEGINIGREKGRAEGEWKLGRLIERLIALNRNQDIARVASDPDYRNQLYREFNI